MQAWILLDTAPIPGGGEMRLLRRGDEFAINVGRDALMNSRMRGSEEALARLGCGRLAGLDRPRVLIGGLGLGFTLRAALALLGPCSDVVVAELVPAVVAWGKGPLAPLHGDSLGDPRVTIHEGDVGRIIRAAPAAYDAILLDVDNGPEGLTHHGNDRLYDRVGLKAARAALRPGGILAVWSAHPDDAFARRLGTVGFSVETASVRAHGKRGARHTIWVAERMASGR